MKKTLFLSIILLLIFSCNKKDEINKTAEISCGQCNFNLEGDDCNLAVRFNNKTYFIDGFGIDDFGDAHDLEKGFCNVIRKGKITGKVINDKFKASTIKVID